MLRNHCESAEKRVTRRLSLKRGLTGSLAAITMLLGLAGPIGNTTVARADEVEASSVTVTIENDGTAAWSQAPGTSGAADATTGGYDAGPKNGIVRTNDTVTYMVTALVAEAGELTLTSEAPTGMTWDPASIAGSDFTGSTVSPDGKTLTLVLHPKEPGQVRGPVTAKVLNIGNNTNLPVTFTAGSITSNTVTVKVSAAPKVNLLATYQSPTYEATNDGQFGNYFRVWLYLWVPIDPATGVKGAEPLQNEFSFDLTPPSDHAVPYNCGAQRADNQGFPGTLSTSGAWSCSQDGGPGTAVTVTVTGAASSVATYPQYAYDSTTDLAAAGRAYFAAGYVYWFVPADPDTPQGVPVQLISQAVDFDPLSVTNQSNYGDCTATSCYAPNMAPGADQVVQTTSDANATANVSNTVSIPFTFNPLSLQQLSVSVRGLNVQAPASYSYSGNGALTAGSDFNVSLNVYNPLSSVTNYTHVSDCLIWDPTQATIGSDALPTTVADRPVKAEYGIVAYADPKNANCGYVGDAGTNVTWFADLADVPGGAAAVTAVRYTFQDVVTPGMTVKTPNALGISSAGGYFVSIPLTASATLTEGDVIALYRTTYFESADYPTGTSVASTYDPSTNSGPANLLSGTGQAGGARVTIVTAQVRNTVAWDVTQTNELGTRTVTVTPLVTVGAAGAALSGLTETVTLPAGVTFVTNSAKWGNNDTPLIPQIDGQTLTFDLPDDVAVGNTTQLTFQVNVSPMLTLPATEIVSAVINYQYPEQVYSAELDRTATAALLINAAESVMLTKTASTASAQPGVPYDYIISWANRTKETMRDGYFVDLLPFVGDGRGTTGLNGLTVNDVVIDPADQTNAAKECTATPAATVKTALLGDGGTVAGDATGNTGIDWTTPCSFPSSTITAIRFKITAPFNANSVGAATITVTPGELSASGKIYNDVLGTVEGWDSLGWKAESALTSSASVLAGNVYQDLNYSFGKDTTDTGVANPQVQITGGYNYGVNGKDDGGPDATDSDDIAITSPITALAGDDAAALGYDQPGDYVFPGLAAGNYEMTVTAPDGTQVAVAPALDPSDPDNQPVKAGPSETGTGLENIMPATVKIGVAKVVTGADFGVQKPLTLKLQGDELSGPVNTPISQTTTDAASLLTNDTITLADSTWQVPDPTITADVTPTRSGTAKVNVDDTAFTYTPPTGLFGANADSFTYTVTDAQGHTATATVDVTLTAALPYITPGSTTVLLDSSQENPSVTTTITNTVTLDPGATLGTCEIVGDASPATGQASVIEGTADVNFTATATGEYTFSMRCQDSFGQWGDTSEVKVTVVSQAITVELQGVKAGDKVGDLITWTYTVTNTGTADLTDVAITDSFTRPADTASAITCPALEDGVLKPGDSIECTGTSVITQAQKDAGVVLNEANATGLAVVGDSTAPAVADPSQVSVKVAQLPNYVTPGSTTVLLDSSQENPSVTTTITNTVTLDPDATLSTCKIVSSLSPVAPHQASLIDGTANMNFTATAVGEYIFWVHCQDSFGQWGDTSEVKVTVVSQAITVELQGVKAGDKVGDLITWTYTVKNTGTADLTDIAITDSFTRPTDTASAITCPALEDGILKPGDSIECTATSTITQAQKDAGIVLNEANATGLAVVGDSTAPAVADPSQASVKVAQNPKVDIVKNALLADANGDKQANVGEQITFEITLTNLGDVTINNLSVIDTMPMTLTCTDQASGATVPNGKITLAPDPKATVVCKSDPYTITADDLAAGEVVNKATYSGDVGTPGSDKVYGEGNGTTTKINGGSEVTVTVTAPEAPTGGWMANTNWAWAWLFGAGLLVAGGCLLMRRRAQRQAGEAR